MASLTGTCLQPGICNRKLESSSAAGFLVASVTDTRKMPKIIAFSSMMPGFSIIIFSMIKNVYASIAAMSLIGFFMILQMAFSNTSLQLAIHDEMRGRVMGFFTMAFMGFAPVGSLIAGALAHRFGAPITSVLGGIACLTAGVAFTYRHKEVLIIE